MEKRAMGKKKGFLAKTLLLVMLFSSALLTAGESFAQPGDIHTYAGIGVAGYSSDGIQANASKLYLPYAVATDGGGNLYIADRSNQRVRKVDASGIITTVAGKGTPGFSGDGGPATSAALCNPSAVALDGAGNLYIADRNNNRIRKVDASGVITTIAGSGKPGYSGDGKSALNATLRYPEGIAVDPYGNVYISDTSNNCIRKVGADGVIYTVAGTIRAGYSGDGGPAVSARLYHPESILVDGAGSLFIADYGNNRIRKIDASGTITTVAGFGSRGYSGDGGPATSARLFYPFGITGDAAGNLYISGGDNRIRMVDALGTIYTVAGTGRKGYSGDGGPATSAMLGSPSGIATDPSGNLYIADRSNNRVRVVEGQSFGSKPVSDITSPGNGVTVTSSNVYVTGNAASVNGISFVEVSTDSGSSWSTASGTTTWDYNWHPKNNGTYKLMSRATDTLNNVQTDPATATVTVNIDTTPPSSAITSPASGSALSSSSSTISGTATDGSGSGVTKVEVSTDGGSTWTTASGTTSWSYAWAAPANGSYTIKSRATDSTGNTETPGSGVSVTVNVPTADTAPPSSSISSPSSGATLSATSVTITGTATDGTGSGVSKVEVSTNGGSTWTTASGTTSWNYSWTLPSNGSYTIKSRATDNAGNTETPGSGVSVTVDKTAPSSTVASPASGALLKGTSATISGSATDGSGSGVTKVEVSTDGGSTWKTASGTTSWNYSWTLPSSGSYTIKSRATDKAGNVETPGSGVSVTVDKTAPSSAVTSPASGATLASSSSTITGTATDGSGSGVAKVEVSTDGGSTWTTASGTTSWSYSWTAPANGSYTIKSRATDGAGNTETPGSGISVTVNVPAPPPVASQMTLAWDPSSSAGVTGYKLYIGTAPGVYTRTIDAGNVTSYTVTGLTQGVVYYYAATSYDAGGNESGYSNEVSKAAP